MQWNTRDNLYWSLRESFNLHPQLLPLNFQGLYPRFELLVVMQFADTAHIPEMVQAIFYTMVMYEVADKDFRVRMPWGAQCGTCRS